MRAQSPTVQFAEVDLLKVFVVATGREQRLALAKVFIQVATLREGSAVNQTLGRISICRGEQ